jgi:formylmethanofuran dehydrogenase subunit A
LSETRTALNESTVEWNRFSGLPILRSGADLSPDDNLLRDNLAGHVALALAGVRKWIYASPAQHVIALEAVLGMPLDDVVMRSTWNPAKIIHREDLGHLSPGAPADIAVLRVEKGSFGFADTGGKRMRGDRKLTCELTVREGKIVYDLNAISAEDQDKAN